MREKSFRWASLRNGLRQGAIATAIGATVLTGGCATTNQFRAFDPIIDICKSNEPGKCNRKNRIALIEELRQSSVLIKNSKSQGSGVIIGHNGNETVILTNRHVVDPDSGRKIPDGTKILNNGRVSVPTRILIAPDDIDLAIVFVKGVAGPCRKMFGESPAVGSNVIVVGSPLGSEDSVTKGIISNLNPEKTKNGFSYFTIQTDAAVNPGNSGGGIFDAETGNLIGIISFKIRMSPFETAEGMAYAIPITILKSFPYAGWEQAKPGS